MMWAIRRRCRSDAGFTMMEVAMSTVIFFIAFTGIMSLMVANTWASSKAQEKAMLVNAANSYIEQVRSMPYAAIVSLPTTTTTTGGFDITISPSVSWVDDPTIYGTADYKKLTVLVTAARGADTQMSYTAETVIKDADSGTNTNAVPPVIDFTASSPGQLTAVSGTAVDVGAIAGANGANVTLVSMNFYVDGVPMVNSSGGTAQWSVSGTSATKSIMWDTTAVNEDGVPRSVDGMHTITVECWDSNQRQSFVQRQVIVDNSPPPTPGAVTATPETGTSEKLTWDEVLDGTTPVDRYTIRVWRQTTADNDPLGYGEWNELASTTSYDNAPSIAVDPLSRYYFSVRAVSPAPNSFVSDPSGTVGLSRPSLSGTYSTVKVGKNKTAQYTSTVNLELSEATFPYASVTNTLYRSGSSSMAGATAVVSGPGWTYTDTATGGQNGVDPVFYQVKTVITPSGWRGGTPVELWSQVLGPVDPYAASGTLPTVRW